MFVKENADRKKKINWKTAAIHTNITQPAFTCTKLTIETLEQGVKYVHMFLFFDAIGVILVSLLLTLNIFHTLF